MDYKKIGLYVFLAFAISWASFAFMFAANIEYGSLSSTIILALFYMSGPAIATFIVQKFIYKEDFRIYGWTFNKNTLKLALLYAPLLFICLILLTFGVVLLFGNSHLIPQFGYLDFSDDGFRSRLQELIGEKADLDAIGFPSIPATLFFGIFIVQGIIAGLTFNLPFMFGEEFGWRGLMVKETGNLGFLKASVFIGIIWGIWHLPLILAGHNYPQHPYSGILMMCLFTTALSPIFSYLRIKTKSILGPCFLHGMINATGTIFVLFIADPNELFSSIAGWAGIISGSVIVLGIVLLDRKFVANYSNSSQNQTSPAHP